MKRYEFEVHGPFEVPPKADSDFWQSHPDLASLADRVGCYVFALRSVKGSLTPHYVGLTRRRFGTEVFNKDNLKKFARAQSAGSRAKAVVFLIVPSSGKKKGNRKYIGELESFFIGAAFARNPAVQNQKGVLRPNWRVPGVVGKADGKPTRAAQQLRRTLGFSKQSR